MLTRGCLLVTDGVKVGSSASPRAKPSRSSWGNRSRKHGSRWWGCGPHSTLRQGLGDFELFRSPSKIAAASPTKCCAPWAARVTANTKQRAVRFASKDTEYVRVQQLPIKTSTVHGRVCRQPKRNGRWDASCAHWWIHTSRSRFLKKGDGLYAAKSLQYIPSLAGIHWKRGSPGTFA